MNARLFAAALLSAALAAGPAVAQTNRGGTMTQDRQTTEERQSDTDVNQDRSSGGVNRSEEQQPSDRSMKTQETQETQETKESTRRSDQGKSKKKHHKHHKTVKEQKTEKTIETPSDVNEGGSVR